MSTVIEDLRTLLNKVCEGRLSTTPTAIAYLNDSLMNNKSLLVNLLDDSVKKPEHRSTLISGKPVINGKEFRVNEDFIKQSVYISDHLNLDEFTSARLLLDGITLATTVNSTPLDTAVYLYHAERGYILTILNIILEAAKDDSIDKQTRNVFKRFIGELINEKTTKGSFIKRIIQATNDISVMSIALDKDGRLDSAKDSKQQLLTQLSPQYQQQAQDGSLAASIQEMDFVKETLELRKEKLAEERISLVQILYHISSLFWLPEEDLIDILTKVQSMNLSDSIATYMLTAFLAALSVGGYEREGNDFSKNDTFLKKLHEQITNKSWKVNTLEAVVHIQWSLFTSHNKKIRSDTTFSFDTTQLVKTAIASDVFEFMNNYLLYFKQKEETEYKKIQSMTDEFSAMEIDGLIVDPNDYAKFNVDINSDFQKFVIFELELLTQSFIVNMIGIFHDLNLKIPDDELIHRQNTEEIDNSFSKFLILLASIYRDRRDAGLKFWKAKNKDLYKLLLFLVEVKVTQCFPALFDFFGSISTGIESAADAHAMFKAGINIKDIDASNLFSWGKLFASLQFYGNLLRDIKSDEEPPIISSIEEATLCKYLYLCQQVVQYSDKARLEIWSDPILSAHASIVGMINAPTSTKLRSALYDLLTSFCSNWGGGVNGVGKKIALEVWETLEHSGMIIPNKTMVTQPTEAVTSTPIIPLTENSLFSGVNTIPTPSTTTTPKPPPKKQQYFLPQQLAGFSREFQEEEKVKRYTETQSVLNFLASLIHTPSKRDELVTGFALIEPSVPKLLGANNKRTPGTAPYISLVVDHIFLKLKNVQYCNVVTRWRLTDSCLAIIENSILSFNIDPLVDHINYINQDKKATIQNYTDILASINAPKKTTPSPTILQNSLLDVITQPGYDILVRILSGGGLIHELFKIVEKGKDAISKSKKEDKDDSLKSCMTRCLRIFSKVFSIQNAFVNVVIPQLNLISTKQSMGQFQLGNFIFPSPPSTLGSLGKLMLHNTEVIVQIALMINCDEYEDICELSTTVLSELASQPQNNSVTFPDHINIPMGGIGSFLAGVLLSSPKSSSIIFSISERLEIESAEVITYDDYEYDINLIPFWFATETMSNIYRFDENKQVNHTLSVRITLLDMMLKNMSKEIKSPTVTEFLLGYDVKELETLGFQQKSIPTDVHHKSQLACLSSILNMLSKGIEVEEGMEIEEGTEEKPLILTHPVLAEKCYQLIYQLCARDSTSNVTLHYLRNNTDNFLAKQFKAIACRLETCVEISEPYFEGTLLSADQVRISTDYFTMVSCLNQRAWLLKLIALELHLKHENSSTLLNLLYGCSDKPESMDFLTSQMEELQLRLETTYQQPLWNMLEIVNSLEFVWIDGLAELTTNIPLLYFNLFDPERHTIEKDNYKIYDIRTIYKVLRQHQTTDPTYSNLNDSERIAMENEMGSILKRLMAENRNREISHARLHCLRAWKQVIQVTISDCFDALSFEAREKIIYDLLSVLLPKLEHSTGLHVDILKGLSEVTLSLLARLRQDKRRQSILRVTANATSESRLPDEKLRMMFISIIHCIRKEDSTIEVRSAMYSALVNLLQYIQPEDQIEDTIPGDIRSQVIEIIGGERKEKLLDIICTDASKGLAMYKTTAYMALEVLYVLVTKSRNSSIHQYLNKRNFLQFTIRMIHNFDSSELTRVIQERDACLTPMYNFEAKISLFMQMALENDGAAALLSNDLLSYVDNCKFMNICFDRNQLADSNNTYKAERHARLLTPILELMNALLVSVEGQSEYEHPFRTWIKDQKVLVDILKDEKTKTTLSALYMLQLTTSLLYQLSCQQDYFNEMESIGLGELDSFMMNLIPKYFLPRDWASVVEPVGVEEINWSKYFLPNTVGYQDSLLVTKAEKYITNIRKNLISYARNSTFRTNSAGIQSFKPIIANTLDSIKEQPNTMRRVSSMTPSLTTLVSSLSYTGKTLAKKMADFDILLAQKDNVGSLKYDEIQEIVNTAIPKGFDIKYESLNPSQQSQLLTTEINRRIKLKEKEIRDLNSLLENVLVILWRHLSFYLDYRSISTSTTLSPCERHADETVVLLQQLLFQTSPHLIEKLKSACKQELEPVLVRLDTIFSSSSLISSTLLRLRKCYN